MKKAQLQREAKERARKEAIELNKKKLEETGLAFKEEDIPPGKDQ